MSLSQIEAELEHLTPEELRQLAIKSWNAFVQKEASSYEPNECSEDDPVLLRALDDATGKADANLGQGWTGTEVRARLREWTNTK